MKQLQSQEPDIKMRDVERKVTEMRVLHRPPAIQRSFEAPVHELAPFPIPRLPLPLTSFVGRARELTIVGALLNRTDVRLVTLTGPGGVGKTRLALRVAEEWQAEFTDGVAYVPLADERDPDRLAAVVAESIGGFGQTTGDPADAVESYLASRAYLLILDNFEHLLEAAPVLARWLSHCPWLTILVTSRFCLRVSGEHEVAIRPLPLPVAETDCSLAALRAVPSVQLFLERAQAARSDFALNPANAAAIAALCSRLEGLPLAIELAAARMSHMGPGDLLERLGGRLPLLMDGPHDQPDRLRSLERAIAWSFDLLTTSEQILLQQLSVFAGGFDLDAAEAVAGIGSGTIDGIASLVNKSFLEAQEAKGVSRYTMLESIREFAALRLDAAADTNSIRDRHAAYFVELAEREDVSIWGGHGHRQSLDRLERDLANMRVALAWLDASGSGPALLRLAAALSGIWHYRSHWREARVWLNKGLLMGGASAPRARAIALAKLTVLDRDLLEGPDAAKAAEAVDIFRAIEDERGVGRSLLLASTLVASDDVGRQLALLEASEFHSTRARSPTSLGWVQLGYASLHRRTGDLSRAREHMREAVACFRQDEFLFGITCALIELAVIESKLGNRHCAANLFREAIGLWPETRSKELLFNAMSRIAEFAFVAGQMEAAVSLLSSLDALGQSASLQASPIVLERADHLRAQVITQLGEDRFAAAWAGGRQATVDRLITGAMDLLASIGTAASAGERPLGGLTEREGDVIRLLSQGKSNREIAAELSISESTAISHVRNILSKLGVSSRTAAAAWAIRHGFDQPL
ncbi:MAG: LuxR C-terminal-related transcriptional regulator [Thermomicrobiales bacterium]